MFDNALNRDTVLFLGMTSRLWLTLGFVCSNVNEAGYALTMEQCERLLDALVMRGKVVKDRIVRPTGRHEAIWKRVD